MIAAVRALPRGRTAFVGIDGFGGAGKTSLARSVADAVDGASVVAVDDFSSPRIGTWDWPRFRAQVLEPLLAGRPARYQRWDWSTDLGVEWVVLAAGRIVVVEGVSATRVETGVPWDLQVWVDAPRDVRLQRVHVRDGAAMSATWLEDWIPSEDRYAAEQRPLERMDLIVDGTG